MALCELLAKRIVAKILANFNGPGWQGNEFCLHCHFLQLIRCIFWLHAWSSMAEIFGLKSASSLWQTIHTSGLSLSWVQSWAEPTMNLKPEPLSCVSSETGWLLCSVCDNLPVKFHHWTQALHVAKKTWIKSENHAPADYFLINCSWVAKVAWFRANFLRDYAAVWTFWKHFPIYLGLILFNLTPFWLHFDSISTLIGKLAF